MKNIVIALLMVVTIGATSLPISAQAATRAELLQQIETLTKLISLLQKQLELKKQLGTSASDTTVSVSTQTGDTLLDLVTKVKVTMPVEKSYAGRVILFYGDNSSVIIKRVGPGEFSGTYEHSYSKVGDYVMKLVFANVNDVDAEIGVLNDPNHPKNTLLKTIDISIDENNPHYLNSTVDWSEELQGVLREKPDVKGYLSVQQVNATAMQLSGSITPHDECVGTENMQVILDYGNGSSKSFTLRECKMIFFKESVVYTPSLIPIYPTLKLKWEDGDNNVWQYSELSRYMLNLSNPLNPTITNLGVNGEKG